MTSLQFSWTGFREYITNMWSKLTTPQKFVLVAVPLVIAIALLVLVSWANKPQFVPIFTKISDSEAGAIKQKLQELKIEYQLTDNGSTILVPKQQASEVRLDLANSGLPQGSKFSFDNLNEIHLGETEADRKLRYILGLQTELETTLKSLQGVLDARVHITIPEPRLFIESEKEATAAVTLKLSPDAKVEESQIRAVANLLSSSVEGLKPEKVTIVDTNGNVLSDLIQNTNDPGRLSGSQLQMQQVFESDIEKSLQTMLERVFGPGKTVVRANVVLDFDQIKIVTQKKGPGALVSKQTLSENIYNGNQATSIETPSEAQSGLQSYTTPSQADNTSAAHKNQTTENYEIDSTQEERQVSPGTVKRLSVSVLADAEIVTESQLLNIKAAVASAVGYDESRGDQIQVAAIPFDKTGIKKQEEAIAAAERSRANMTYTKLAVAVVLALILLLVIWLSRRRRESDYSTELETSPIGNTKDFESAIEWAKKEAAASALAANVQEPTQEDIEREKMREAVEAYSRQNPEVVARLVKSWLTEEK